MRSAAEHPGHDNDPRDPPARTEDDLAFERFYHQHYLPVVRYLASTSGAARFVEDAAQEAMAVLWIKWSILVDDPSKRKGYLFVTAKRALLRMLSKPDSRFLPLEPEKHGQVDGVDLAIEWIECNLDITAFLGTLPAMQREAATLAWLCDFSEREIARVLAIRPGTVKSHLWRARRALRRHEVLAGQLNDSRGEAR